MSAEPTTSPVAFDVESVRARFSALQTSTAAKIGDWATALTWAATNGASSVELPTGYTSWSLGTLGALGFEQER